MQNTLLIVKEICFGAMFNWHITNVYAKQPYFGGFFLCHLTNYLTIGEGLKIASKRKYWQNFVTLIKTFCYGR